MGRLALQRELVDIGTLITSAIGMLHDQSEARNVKLSVCVADTVPATVHIDPEKIAWAVSCLVRRALKSMPSTGGVITVEVGYDVNRSLASIVVGDNGPAAESDLQRPNRDLSLFLVESIAAGHDGHLDIATQSDRLDRFTQIRLTIPDV
jgi:signal transduction histidine kinase